ncbi:MAG: AAA family ATPase [Candidatus Omnitrophica bacterium]|nr:AAA family ATPase [Candidatus Omnitrophota bacterium]
MYKEFYQLKENPFNVTADPGFYFSSEHHNEAFSHLLYGIKQRKGIIVLTGEVGTGKTTLCRKLLSKLDEGVKTAFILNPRFSDIDLLKFILKDLGIKGNYRNKFSLINALNEFLISEASKGGNVVVMIDEAQNLKVPQLEQVRLLSNLETEKEKLLQIILVGQPELDDKLKLEELRQLNQRISVRYNVPPLEEKEVGEYIEHRIKKASASSEINPSIEFTAEAIKSIYKFSDGIPRIINIICDRALLAGYVNETHTFDNRIVHQCIREVSLK